MWWESGTRNQNRLIGKVQRQLINSNRVCNIALQQTYEDKENKNYWNVLKNKGSVQTIDYYRSYEYLATCFYGGMIGYCKIKAQS